MDKKTFTEDEVLNEAYKRYGKPVYTDQIKEAMSLETFEDAVNHIIDDSAYWDWDPTVLPTPWG